LNELENYTDFFKCLSDPSRLRILYLIVKTEEMCIADLELILDYSQTKTSRHLNYMKRLRLLGSKKYDQWVYYFVLPDKIQTLMALLDDLDEIEMLRKDLYEYRTLYTNNELAVRAMHTKQKKFKLPPL
jgi:ArsR family transcriptional regulator, arsenate/arsenite/antimonite-responsive transcriptional repressor